MNQNELVQAIEFERTKMEKLILEKDTLGDPCIIKISQVLDKLIAEYHKSLLKNKYSSKITYDRNC